MVEQIQRLYYSIRCDDIDTFKREWTPEISNSYKDNWGVTLLHEAVSFGRIEFIQLMLENGTNPNGHTAQWKSTPLMFGRAMPRHMRTHIHFLLLRYGGDPYKKNLNGKNAFEMYDRSYDYMESYLVVELVCAEADNLSLDMWRVIKPFIYNI